MAGRGRNHSSSHLTIIAALLVVFCSNSFSQVVGYPHSHGPVSDYAGRLSQAQITELASLIQDYERQTSVEIAVVVADSLQGQSAREYATGIGDSWGVGKSDRNNGVVLLWAPNERVYALRVADGLSTDLTDDDATKITHNHLLPNFRREAYYDGLKETVNAVMSHLGNETWEERLRLRQERGQSFPAWLIAALVAAVAFGAAVLVIFYRRRNRNLKLHEMAAVPESIAQSLFIAERNTPRIQQLLDDFKKEMPEQDLSRFTSDLADQPNRIAKVKTAFANLNVKDISLYTELLQAKDDADAEANLLSSTQWKLNDVRRAKAQSQQIMQRLSTESFQIADVKDGSKRGEVDSLLFNSRSLYNQANQNSSMSVLDWIVINDLLNSSQRQVQQAAQISQTQPDTTPLFTDSTSTFTTDNSDTSSFGSSGDFGGGGGFSGGSGSDGSY
jgi:uncharacterized protein